MNYENDGFDSLNLLEINYYLNKWVYTIYAHVYSKSIHILFAYANIKYICDFCF